MKTKSTLQILNAELNTCKANAPREKVMVAGGWFIKETAEQTKKDLKEFKAFVKEKFRQQASDLVVYFGHSRQKAEAAALETARSRIKCWKEAQAYESTFSLIYAASCAGLCRQAGGWESSAAIFREFPSKVRSGPFAKRHFPLRRVCRRHPVQHSAGGQIGRMGKQADGIGIGRQHFVHPEFDLRRIQIR